MSESMEPVLEEGRVHESQYAHLSIANRFRDELLQIVLSVIQDGICLLSADLEVLYANPAMRLWFDVDENTLGSKCYEVYHNRTEPCIGCPALKVMMTKRMESEERRYGKEKNGAKWHRVFCAPILNSNNEIIMYIEYVREITAEKKTGLSVELMQDQIVSLRDIIEQKDEEQRKKEQQIIGNMNRSIDRVLKYLNNILDEDIYSGVRQHFELTMHGINNNQPSMSVQLSGQELLIARYIAKGYLSKEIADELDISKKTVDYHRTNLRKKLALKPNDNLRHAIEQFFVECGI